MLKVGMHVLDVTKLATEPTVKPGSVAQSTVPHVVFPPRRIYLRRIVAPRAIECRPTDDVEFVHVANAVYVGARIGQGAHHLEVPACGSPVQRAGVVSGFARVRIRTVLEQQPYGVHVPVS